MINHILNASDIMDFLNCVLLFIVLMSNHNKYSKHKNNYIDIVTSDIIQSAGSLSDNNINKTDKSKHDYGEYATHTMDVPKRGLSRYHYEWTL